MTEQMPTNSRRLSRSGQAKTGLGYFRAADLASLARRFYFSSLFISPPLHLRPAPVIGVGEGRTRAGSCTS
jgi:hypothetical protein